MAALLAVYALLALPTVGRLGITWDEQTDLQIAEALLATPDGWLVGSPDDPSQTRLPMFVVALVGALLGRFDLTLARVVSVAVGGLTLVGVFCYCRQRLDAVRGLLACALLATSPFFLAFARVAFTESDISLACALTWLLVFADRLQDGPTLGKGAAAGVVLGLALSSKATSLAVLPALWFVTFRPLRSVAAGTTTPLPWRHAVVAIAGIGAAVVGALATAATLPSGPDGAAARALLYAALLAAWLLVLGWSAWRREQQVPAVLLAAFLTGVAALTFFVLPPEHLTNPAILDGLHRRVDVEMGLRPAFVLEAAALHVLSVLFKSGVASGAGLLLAAAATLAQARRRSGMQLPLLLVGTYSAGLLTLPLAQPFYTIPVLPMLAVFAADQFLRLRAHSRRVAGGVAAVVVLSVGVDLVRCYPDYNLNGYQWLGARMVAGRPSIGYRSIVQTPSDGVEQAFRWLNGHAGAGRTVLAYVLPWHIVRAVAPRPVYTIYDPSREKVASPDYIVTEINASIPGAWWNLPGSDVIRPPYDPVWLRNNYTRVFAVERIRSRDGRRLGTQRRSGSGPSVHEENAVTKFDPTAARERVRNYWALDAEFGLERTAYFNYLQEIVSDRGVLVRGMQLLRDELQLAVPEGALGDMTAAGADLSLPSVVSTLAHTNCGDRIHQGEATKGYERVVASRFAMLSEIGELKLEAFAPTGGGTDDGATLAHVTVAHHLDTPLRRRIYDGNASSFELVCVDIKTHCGRMDEAGATRFGVTRESPWREPRAACGAIVGMLSAFDPNNPVHQRLRRDLGEDNFAFLTARGVQADDGTDLTPVVAAAIVALQGKRNVAQALVGELDERGVGVLTASITINRVSMPDTVIYLGRASVFEGEVRVQGIGMDARRFGGHSVDLLGGSLQLTYDGRVRTGYPVVSLARTADAVASTPLRNI